MKTCSVCKRVLSFCEFSTNGVVLLKCGNTKKYYKSACKACNSRRGVNHRRVCETTYLKGKWRAMMERCEGLSSGHQKYIGMEYPGKDEFLSWALKREDFKSLFKDWGKHGFSYCSSPSIDRIDNSKGYLFDNMQFLKLKENSVKDRGRDFTLISPDGVAVSGNNISRFCREEGLNASCIYMVLSGCRKTHKGWKKNDN